MSVKISRHFATVDGVQVHYRLAGEGPPVVLFHQSPRSSAEYLHLIEKLAVDFTVIAPDNPGNGISDPLPLETVTMRDIAEHYGRFLDTIGLTSVTCYGFHTGGAIALEVARRRPDIMNLCVSAGFVKFDDQAMVDDILANYLPPYEMDWAGTHLTWTWARMREQLIFFPWYKKDAASRMPMDLPDKESLHESVMDLLITGDHYRNPYRAAFTHDSVDAVAELTTPTVIMSAKTDVLNPHLQNLPPLPAGVTVEEPVDFVAAEDRVHALFKEHAKAQDFAPSAAAPLSGKLYADFLQVDGASFYCRRNDEGSGRPIVFIHASAGSSRSGDRWLAPFIGNRPVLAIDLPGNGDSDQAIEPSGLTTEQQAAWLARAIKAAGYESVDILGHWGGGSVGIELALQEPSLVNRIAAPSLMIFDDATRDDYLANYTPDIVLDEYGGHLVHVWNTCRDQELYGPWFKRKKDNVLWGHEPDIAPEVLHQRLVDVFKAGPVYPAAYAAHFKYPMADKLPQVGCPVLVGSPNGPMTQMLEATGASTLEAKDIPAGFGAAASAILDWFNA